MLPGADLKVRAREGYCVVEYVADPKGPAHLAKRFTTQGVDFDSGVPKEVTATGATAFLLGAPLHSSERDKDGKPKSTGRVIDGTPAPWAPTRPVHRAGSRQMADLASPFSPPQ